MYRARSIALVALMAAGMVAMPDERSHVSLVPWKVVERSETVDAPLVLFWVPESAAAMRRSPLLTSDALTRYSARCVAMRVVRVDDTARLAKLGVGEVLPVAVLTERGGRIVGSVPAERVADVEDLVADELDARTFHADALLESAQRKAAEGDLAEAEKIYRDVWEARCLCPRQARVAQKALRRLGRGRK